MYMSLLSCFVFAEWKQSCWLVESHISVSQALWSVFNLTSCASAPLVLAVLDGMERLTAEEMDERRQQNMAYEYLCHLEEAKR